MTDEVGLETPARNVPGRSSRKRHWWRWILAGVAVLVVLVVLAVGLFIKLQPTPSPLVLPTAAAGAPAGPLDGTWTVAAGSVAGFRVRESAVGMSNDVVGRTNAFTGTITVSGDRVTRAAFHIDLTTIRVGGKPQPQFAKSLDTQAYPGATFTLAQPVTLGPGFTSGATITATAIGHLVMHGASHLVTFTISGRRNGSALQAAGSIPIAFSGWGIKGPKGYGFFGSLANHGVAECLLVLHRSDTAP
ncbi:MAG: YceI family protein [Micromonosporaceae bacterium]